MKAVILNHISQCVDIAVLPTSTKGNERKYLEETFGYDFHKDSLLLCESADVPVFKAGANFTKVFI